MRKFIVATLLSVICTTQADELIQFSDGTTAWRNSNGQVWGKTALPPQPFNYGGQYGQPNNNPSAFGSDGTFYMPGGPNQIIDTRRGGFIPVR